MATSNRLFAWMSGSEESSDEWPGLRYSEGPATISDSRLNLVEVD